MAKEHSLIPEPRTREWTTRGLTKEQERIFDLVAGLLLLLMAAGWALSVHQILQREGSMKATPPPLAASRVSKTMLDTRASSLAYLRDLGLQSVDPLRGLSGELKAGFYEPGSTVESLSELDTSVEISFEDARGRERAAGIYTLPDLPGMYRLALEIDQFRHAVDDFSFIARVPFGEKRAGQIGEYRLGEWPFEEGGTPKSPAYRHPSGFIEITPENLDTHVSTHFRFRDFLTKGQTDVWPKYLVLSPQLIDKLELTIRELEERGVEVEHVTVMSGFRHPYYNYGGGNTQGRANLSRHMYGDAADIFLDNDRDGWTDDVDGDGKITTADAELMADAADAVEREYPSLTGGVGIYPACCGHGPMVHIDTRGYRARWVY